MTAGSQCRGCRMQRQCRQLLRPTESSTAGSRRKGLHRSARRILTLVFETGFLGHIRRPWHFNVECPKAVFMLLDEIVQQKRKPLRRMRTKNNAVGELDGHF